jgi:hypothetical protein
MLDLPGGDVGGFPGVFGSVGAMGCQMGGWGVGKNGWGDGKRGWEEELWSGSWELGVGELVEVFGE